ncbi:MAG TPA: substrate-binding domain-containing protein [Planctomycetota bacterium]|nr:substrate-binding domain-containing protein [Planctomycetota bacterium]
MPPSPRIAVMLDPDKLGFREGETLRGIAQYAEAVGRQLVLDRYPLKQPPGTFAGILVPAHRFIDKAVARCRVPVVFISWHNHSAGHGKVFENRHEAGRLAANHLLERGYRAFAYLGFARHTQSYIERQAFAQALRRLGRRPQSACTFQQYATMESWLRSTSTWLNDWLGGFELPVGIYVARPGFARVLAQLALARGLRIPEDVGIIAADDDPALHALTPALTSIRFDYAELGTRAAELLDRLMHGEAAPRGNVLIEPTLIPRRSTDRQALADDLVARALWFIDDRRTEPIDARQVAAGLGVTQRTLERRLRAAGRGTIAQEIAKARVEHAKLLLEDLARSRVRAQRRRRGRGPVQVVFDGPPADPEGEGWREWHEDPRRRAALVETRPDGTEWIRRHPLPMPDTPLARRGWAGLAGVAHGAGFRSVSALSRAFHRYAGMPPTHWRRGPASGSERPT